MASQGSSCLTRYPRTVYHSPTFVIQLSTFQRPLKTTSLTAVKIAGQRVEFFIAVSIGDVCFVETVVMAEVAVVSVAFVHAERIPVRAVIETSLHARCRTTIT